MDNLRRKKSAGRTQESNPAEVKKGRMILGFEGMNFEQKRKPYQNINSSITSMDLNKENNRKDRQDK